MLDDLPENVKAQLVQARPDIDRFGFDESYLEDVTNEWIVPVEALFTADEVDFTSDIGWHYGNLRIELTSSGELLDYFVGDWSLGYHPEMNTFNR